MHECRRALGSCSRSDPGNVGSHRPTYPDLLPVGDASRDGSECRPRGMNPDFEDFLRALTNASARFMVAGAHALALHGVPRATGDLDIWIDPSVENADRVWKALSEFGAPMESLGITRGDLIKPDMVIQLGLPPRRIDLLTGLSGITFEDAWADRVQHDMGSIQIPFIGRTALVVNKRQTGRLKDRADLEAMGEESQ